MKRLISILTLCFLSTFIFANNFELERVDSLPFKGSGVQYFSSERDLQNYTPDAESYASEIAFTRTNPNCYYNYDYNLASWIKICGQNDEICSFQDSVLTQPLTINGNFYSVLFQFNKDCILVPIDTFLREAPSNQNSLNLGNSDLTQTDISRFYDGLGENSGSSLNWRNMSRFLIAPSVATFDCTAKTINLGNEQMTISTDSLRFSPAKEPVEFQELPFLLGIDGLSNIRKVKPSSNTVNYINIEHTEDDETIIHSIGEHSFVVSPSMSGKQITEVIYVTETPVTGNTLSPTINVFRLNGTSANTLTGNINVNERSVSLTNQGFLLNTGDKIRITFPPNSQGNANGMTATLKIE